MSTRAEKLAKHGKGPKPAEISYEEMDAFLDRVAAREYGGASSLALVVEGCLDRLAKGGHVRDVRHLTDRVIHTDRSLSDAKVRELTEANLAEGIGAFKLGRRYYEGGKRIKVMDPSWLFYSVEIGADVNNRAESTVVRLRFQREPWSEDRAWHIVSLAEAIVLFGDPATYAEED